MMTEPGKPTIKKRRWLKRLLVLSLIALLLGAGILVAVRRIYNQNLLPVTAAQASEVVFTVDSGASLDEIAANLKEQKLIRADWAFKQYVRSQELGDLLKAGTYRLRPSQDVKSIVQVLVEGRVAADLFTIFPAQRLSSVRESLIKTGGYSEAEVDKALDPAQYPNHPALVDKPAASNLEGYLYPDSYQKIAQTTPGTIVRAALDEMAEVLTPDVRAGIAKQGLSVHEGIIIASIVEQEIPASAKEDRRKAAQVFLKRISVGMQLGSDVTAFYGAALAGINKPEQDPEKYVFYPSPYNTRLENGIPPGPIGNVTKDGLESVASPANTDFLYFVAGDGDDAGITYFSRTLEEHQTLTAQHCKSCGG